MRSRLIIGVEQSHDLYYPGSGAFVLRKAVCKLGIILQTDEGRVVMIDLSGKTALVTGASRGIGEAAARKLAAYGANVVLMARSSSDIERIAGEIGNKALAVTCDVSDHATVAHAINQGLSSQ